MVFGLRLFLLMQEIARLFNLFFLIEKKKRKDIWFNQIAVLTYKLRKFATWYGTINNIKIEIYETYYS